MNVGSRVVLGCIIVSGLSVGAGCKRVLREALKKGQESSSTSSSTTDTAPTTAPVAEWKDSQVSFKGTKAKGSVLMRGTSYDVSFSDLPANAKVTVGGKSASANSSGYVAQKVDVTERLAALAPKDAFDSSYAFDPQTKAEVEFSPTAKVMLDLPARPAAFGLSDLFKKAADTPVPFVTSQPAGSHTVVLTSIPAEVLGPAKTLKEVDWVAVSENLPPRKGKTCSGYKKDKGDTRTSSYQLEMVDQRLSVYEVATSKLVEAKDFKASETCPMMTFNGAAKSYPPAADPKRWLRELRAKK